MSTGALEMIPGPGGARTPMLPVVEASQVGEARRMVAGFVRAAQPAAGEAFAGNLAIVATELATNMVKHGGGGQLGAAQFADAAGQGIELLALDAGRGIASFAQAVRDGYSTAGSPGNGLGAIIRQSTALHVFSRPQQGTVLLARFVTAPAAAGARTELGAAIAPYPGETACGDAWGFAETGTGPTLLLVDGSGHGPAAAEAARSAVASFAAQAEQDAVTIMERLHRVLAGSRGAAVALARIDAGQRVVRFVGVGNIAGLLIGAGGQRHMVSMNGTAGHIAPRIREFTYPWAPGDSVLLHSDGIGTRWAVDTYPGLAVAHPGLITGVVFRDHRRGRDDASAVAMRVPA